MAASDAWTAAVRLLAARALSEAEVRQRLRARGYPEEAVAAAVARLKQRGWLDDRRLARDLIARALEAGRSGPGKIRRQVLARGVPPAVLAEVWPQATAGVDWMAIAEAVFQQYDRVEAGQARERVDAPPPATGHWRRGLRRLAREGFPAAVVARIAERRYPEGVEGV